MALLLVGLMFLIGALAKAIAPWGYLRVIRSISLSPMITIAGVLMVFVEAWMGYALLARPSRKWIDAAIVLLTLFSLFILVSIKSGWMDVDCGCFGSFVSVRPGWALVRNVGLLACLIISRSSGEPTWKPALPGLYLGVVLLGWIFPQAWIMHRIIGRIQGDAQVLLVQSRCPACRNLMARSAHLRKVDVVLISDASDQNFQTMAEGLGRQVVRVPGDHILGFTRSFPTVWKVKGGRVIDTPIEGEVLVLSLLSD